ncbi:MAG: methyltransferase domain-containing protein [bacterium]
MKRITWPGFKKFVDEYEPFSFEVVKGKDLNHLRKNENRMYRMLCSIDKYLRKDVNLCDLGSFPGTFLRVLLHYAKSLNLNLTSAGLLINHGFQDAMVKLGIEVLKVNLDPAHDGLLPETDNPEYNLFERKDYFDIVIASEVFEHMVNPSHLIKVGHDILKPGGYLLVTTPNFAWIGNRVVLVFGRSPNFPINEGILRVGTDRWRSHFRVYILDEVFEVLRNKGFDILHTEYIDERNRSSNFIKTLIYSVPSFRHGLLILANKK